MICIRTNLQTGAEYKFNILQNTEFIKQYGFRNPRLFEMYARELIVKWNKQQPNNWLYKLTSE